MSTFNLFHAFVRMKIRASFAALSAGDPSVALASMKEDVTYTFEGEHALGGTRTSREGVKKWFGRLLRLIPGRFEILGITVSGWPWRARVITEFQDRVTPAFGDPYWNRGVQVIELRWGRASAIHTFVDTAKIARALETMATHGLEEARAPQIIG